MAGSGRASAAHRRVEALAAHVSAGPKSTAQQQQRLYGDIEHDRSFQIRALQRQDYDKGYTKLLEQLTTTGSVSRDAFESFVEHVNRSPYHHVYVVEDTKRGAVVASGTIIIEHKVVHSAGKVGHIEDIVSDSSVRGRGLGRRIVNHLAEIARREHCYKVVLDCAEHNIPFYRKLGFQQKEVQMAKYF